MSLDLLHQSENVIWDKISLGTTSLMRIKLSTQVNKSEGGSSCCSGKVSETGNRDHEPGARVWRTQQNTGLYRLNGDRARPSCNQNTGFPVPCRLLQAAFSSSRSKVKT